MGVETADTRAKYRRWFYPVVPHALGDMCLSAVRKHYRTHHGRGCHNWHFYDWHLQALKTSQHLSTHIARMQQAAIV